ncbi:hypothetical protein CH063_12984 [Colletotrichum higginsianum]|uniref:Uncharacterized protein n=1 Tax=Colletotrichum higginsianum (strain IMI 349063) TaxID=759273 RepID=H1VSL6_COLHI|nr:hypothetical protein CH063_12984 [Colletotrichum higginsianum]
MPSPHSPYTWLLVKCIVRGERSRSCMTHARRLSPDALTSSSKSATFVETYAARPSALSTKRPSLRGSPPRNPVLESGADVAAIVQYAEA